MKIGKGYCLIACLLATCCHQISKEIAERGELGEGCCLFPTSDCRKDFPLVIAGKGKCEVERPLPCLRVTCCHRSLIAQSLPRAKEAKRPSSTSTPLCHSS